MAVNYFVRYNCKHERESHTYWIPPQFTQWNQIYYQCRQIMYDMLVSGYSSWSYWSAQVKRSCGRIECWLSVDFVCVCSLRRSPCTTCSSRHQSLVPPAPPPLSVLLFRARWSIKTILLMFTLFTPVLDHPWMSTLWRVAASGRLILFHRMPVQIILHQGHSDACIMPTSSRTTFKVTLGARACTFNTISPLHYRDELFLLATHLHRVHASCYVHVWYL